MVDIVPVHPGEIVQGLFMEPLEWSSADLAERLHVDVSVVDELVEGHRGIDAELALRLARLFGTQGDYWLRFQNLWDIYLARREAEQTLDAIAPLPREAA